MNRFGSVLLASLPVLGLRVDRDGGDRTPLYRKRRSRFGIGGRDGSLAVAVLRDDLDLDRLGPPLRESGSEGLDPDRSRGGLDDPPRNNRVSSQLGDVRVSIDRNARDGRGRGGLQLQGVPNMDLISQVLAVAGGYIIAFAVGAWIGRPLLELLSSRIFRK